MYEVLVFLKKHIQQRRGQPTQTYVTLIKKEIKIELCHDVIERSMNGTPRTSANEISACVSVTYQESIDNVIAVHMDKELGREDVVVVEGGNWLQFSKAPNCTHTETTTKQLWMNYGWRPVNALMEVTRGKEHIGREDWGFH